MSKRDAGGRRRLENTTNRKMWCDIEQRGRPSKWVTLKAVRALSRIGESEARELARIGRIA